MSDDFETRDRVLRLHLHQSLEYKCIQRGSPYRTVVAIGGIRSGKSLCVALWILDRGRWDTAQMHAIAANTKGQLDTIISDVTPWIESAGVEWQAHKQPPPEWVESWRVRGIKVPPRRTSYRGVFITSDGFHAQLVSIDKDSYKKIKGAKWGSLIIEEVCAGATEDSVRYLFERVNCSLGPVRCAQLHHHVKVLHANPPDDDSHWIFDWMLRHERNAAKKAGVVRRDGDKDEESYRCLLNGIGDVIYIPSRTIDNAENLPGEFIEDMAAGVDDDTAAKILDGVLRRTQKGRVYKAFSYENQIDTIPYDPTRTVYVSLDFNKNPAVALLAHPLKHGEFPSEHEEPNVTHLGVFGEIFHVGGCDVDGLCSMLLNGEPGSDGALPSNFRGLLQHQTRVIFYGDATSNYETLAPKEWPIVNQVIGRAMPGKYACATDTKNNPKVPVGVHAVNRKFLNGNIRSLWIHSRCKHLIEDMLVNQWHKTNPEKIYKPNWGTAARTTHLGDALRYLVSALFPLGQDVDPKANIPRGTTPPRGERPPTYF